MQKDMRLRICTEPRRLSGSLGHVYFVNPISISVAQVQIALLFSKYSLIKSDAQDMADPAIRQFLEFYPSCSTTNTLTGAHQGQKWLSEIDSDLLTPMIRLGSQDYYVLEPTMLQNGQLCVPTRWYVQDGSFRAKAWPMEIAQEDPTSWSINLWSEYEIDQSNLLLSFPLLRSLYTTHDIPNPESIRGNILFFIRQYPCQLIIVFP
jgi:hypothetical protein